MSFSSDTKKEICQYHDKRNGEILAECYGMLLFSRQFSEKQIIFNTENSFVINRFVQNISECFGVIVEKKAVLTQRHGGGNIFTATIMLESDCQKIFRHFGYSGKQINRRINYAVLEDNICVSAFLRGVFLACGSVNNPEKDYHLEFAIPYKNLCNDLIKVISTAERLMYTLKIVERKGIYVAYLKDSEQISDFLAFINAPVASMQIIETKILKEIRNNANRKTNSEVANMKKTITASMKQQKAIEKIRDTVGLESLSDELRQVAVLRLENPEMSLREIGERTVPPVSRSGVNHRMQKLLEIAQE